MQLTIDDLSIRVSAPNRITDDLLTNTTFKLSPKKLYGLVGLNGAGKSTLLETLSGLRAPTVGRVRWNEQDIYRSNKAVTQHLSRVGYCLQQPDSLFFNKTVAEELTYNQTPTSQRLNQIIQCFELAALLNASPFELSGGQKKRLALAIMMVKQPELLLCDELTAGLDTHYRQMVLTVLKQYQREHIVVWVSHDMNELLAYADELLILDHQTITSMPTKALVQDPLLWERHGLPVPFVSQLVQLLHDNGLLRGRDPDYRNPDSLASAIAMGLRGKRP